MLHQIFWAQLQPLALTGMAHLLSVPVLLTLLMLPPLRCLHLRLCLLGLLTLLLPKEMQQQQQ
jgi:hypothetical protein